jgi:hypothetical protein
MAAVVNNVDPNICEPENTMDLDDREYGTQADETNGDGFTKCNFDSYIDEEFANIFDSESEGDDFDAPNTNTSNSSSILAQQLQILKESSCEDVGVSPGVLTPTVAIQSDATDEFSPTTVRQDGEGVSMSQAQKYCEKCHRLQSNSNSVDSGIGDGQKEDTIYTGTQSFKIRFLINKGHYI